MRVPILILCVLMSLTVVADWEPFGPQGLQTNNVCFNAHSYYTFTVCHETGISLYDPVSQDWSTFESDLPVIDAFYLDGTDILLILGRGTDSDGIYTFNPATLQYELVIYLETPHFIYYVEETQIYYVGYRFGLMVSEDGLNWNPVESLENCNIVDMEVYQQHYALAQLDNIYGVWFSYDAGMTWNAPLPGGPAIGDLAFDHYGYLYGIFPDESWSSGLWSTGNYGQSWEVEFWSVNMSSVCIDVMNGVYVGWEDNPTGQEEGIAFYDPGSGHLGFINEGLTSLVINEILINPWMSAIALFCCTDSGACINYDYVGLDPASPAGQDEYLTIHPNPAHNMVHINYHTDGSNAGLTLCIYQANGKKVHEKQLKTAKGTLSIDLDKCMPGLYYFQLTGSGRTISSKVILH